jgi:cobalamin synthase
VSETAFPRLLLRLAFLGGVLLLLLALGLSFTLHMSSHDRFAVTAIIGLLGAALARWAKRRLAGQSGQ